MNTNKNLSWWRICLVLLASLSLLGLGACSDDEASEDDGGSDTTDGTADAGTDGDTADGTDGDATDGDATDGSTDGDATDGSPDHEPLNPTYPADPQGYADQATMTSYVTSLVIPAIDDNQEPECCVDYGDISRYEGLDNALASLAPTIEGLLGSQGAFPEGTTINSLIAEQIAAGSVAIVWDHVQLDGATDEDGFVLVGLLASWAAGTDWATASAGDGEFLISPSSFVSGGTPLIEFDPASMNDGTMGAGPSLFQLSLPILSFNLELTISEAFISGEAVIDTDGIAYTSGELSGFITLETLFGALNDVASGCECLGLGGGDLVEGSDATWDCNPDAVFADCDGDPDEICGALSQIPSNACTLLVSTLSGVADIDTNADDAWDALSVGLTWDATTATVVGVEAE